MNNDSAYITYEDKSDVIDEELRKRRGKWFLKSLAWIDYDDVAQIIRAHIYKNGDSGTRAAHSSHGLIAS